MDRMEAPRSGHRARPALGLALALGLAPVLVVAAAGPAVAQQPGVASGAANAAIQRAVDSRTKGNADASVVVFEIADFQCPYCARFAESVAPDLDERYVATGNVQWIFVNLPLHNHPLAWHAAEAALCAGAAGDAFWPMHDRLFAEQEDWGGADDPLGRFAAYAEELGVPADEYATCVARDQVAPLIVQDVGSAVRAGVNGTPTFIVMKDEQVVERLVGVQSVDDWSRVLDTALGGES